MREKNCVYEPILCHQSAQLDADEILNFGIKIENRSLFFSPKLMSLISLESYLET